MNKLNFISKKNGEVLDSREWNLLVSFINTLIDFYNEFPETVSSFDNDSGYLTLKDIAEYATKGDVASAIQTLINSGGITGPQGEPGLIPYIDNVTKHWMIGDVDTGIISEGKNGTNGITPHIDSATKHWMIGNIDTGIVAEGQNGTNGQNGSNGITPHIDSTTGNWFIGETNTGVSAQGPAGNDGSNGNDGITPHIDSTTGNWFIGNTDTGVHAQGPQGTVSGSLATVATTGDYSDLINTPTIPTVPTNISAFTNDSGYLTSHQDISGKANTSDLATVATSGSYNDLSDTPTIPTVPTALSSFTDDLGSNPTHTHSQYLTSVPNTCVTSTTTGLKIEIVAALPASPDSNTIYIVQ